MTTDNKTLADAQPGGRVRLGDQTRATISDELLSSMAYAVPGAVETTDKAKKVAARVVEIYLSAQPRYLTDAYDMGFRDGQALSAQPSPGGQGDGVSISDDDRAVLQRLQDALPTAGINGWAKGVDVLERLLRESLAARQPVASNQSSGNSGELPVDSQPVGEPVCSGGFVISNGSGEMYMAWGQVGPEWTADRSTALWLVRRADAEALAAENEDAWSILPVERCALPPNGWVCTLAAGHEGPCPTIAAPTAQAMDTWAVIERVAKNWDGCSIGPAIRAEAEKVIGQPAQAVDLGDFKALYRAYVCLLESGRDRIRDLGGTCDPVDVMEANDVDLQAARRVLDSQAVGNG